VKQTARIDHWVVIEMATESRLHGLVSGHPRQHAFPSGMVYTSPIVKLDEAAGVCETNNTIYTLGAKRL
jgi:hypothetical protein